jgi:2-phospho-L-lactate guanylyltransferase (CobY/MobA/RfbA family)
MNTPTLSAERVDALATMLKHTITATIKDSMVVIKAHAEIDAMRGQALLAFEQQERIAELEGALRECQKDAVPVSDIESDISHIEQNGIALAKYGGQEANEGRCRELCAMYLREFIFSWRLKQQPHIDAAKEGRQT